MAALAAVLTLSAAPATAQVGWLGRLIGAAALPTFKSNTIDVQAGVLISVSAVATVNNAGTNPKFTSAVFSTMEYYLTAAVSSEGHLSVQPKTAAQLNALPSPPQSPFEVTAQVTMTNDEGQTATGTLTFETHYVRAPTPGALPGAPSPGTTPTVQSDAGLSAPPGILVSTAPFMDFDNAGTNPRYTGVVFSTMEYYDATVAAIRDGRVWVRAKTAAELNALASPPTNPFTVTAQATMTNDERQTATGTLTFETRYLRAPTPGAQPGASPGTTPTVKSDAGLNAAPGTLVSTAPLTDFDNAGTNPRYTGVVFSTMEYYDATVPAIRHGRVWVRAKTAAELNALASPPTNPFTVTAQATMTNDERQTATGTLTFKTSYNRSPTSGPTPSQPSGTLPSMGSGKAVRNAPTGTMVSSTPEDDFDFARAGTNPRYTGVVFSTMEYYDATGTGVREGRLFVQAKTPAELNALASPPTSPFEVTATVTITGNSGESVSGTLTFKTSYNRSPTSGSTPPSPSAQPTFKQSAAMRSAHVGDNLTLSAETLFDNAGTGARITAVVFSPTDYYHSESGVRPDGTLLVRVKTATELNALPSPPSSPFTVTAEVTMTNDEEQTATGTIEFQTTYDRTAPTQEESDPGDDELEGGQQDTQQDTDGEDAPAA